MGSGGARWVTELEQMKTTKTCTAWMNLDRMGTSVIAVGLRFLLLLFLLRYPLFDFL